MLDTVVCRLCFKDEFISMDTDSSAVIAGRAELEAGVGEIHGDGANTVQ